MFEFFKLKCIADFLVISQLLNKFLKKKKKKKKKKRKEKKLKTIEIVVEIKICNYLYVILLTLGIVFFFWSG